MIETSLPSVSTFSGQSSEDVQSWLQKLELIHNAFDYTQNTRVAHAICLLKGGADAAITAALMLRSAENGERSTLSWESFKSFMIERGVPKNRE